MKLHFGAKTGCCNDVQSEAQTACSVCVWLLECELACECDAVSSVCYDFVCTNDVCLIECSVHVCACLLSGLHQDRIDADCLVGALLNVLGVCMRVVCMRICMCV